MEFTSYIVHTPLGYLKQSQPSEVYVVEKRKAHRFHSKVEAHQTMKELCIENYSVIPYKTYTLEV